MLDGQLAGWPVQKKIDILIFLDILNEKLCMLFTWHTIFNDLEHILRSQQHQTVVKIQRSFACLKKKKLPSPVQTLYDLTELYRLVHA